MPLARDPDTLRIPAFMRKRNLRSRLSKPLVLTALDRKKAGITVVKKEKRPNRPSRLLSKESACRLSGSSDDASASIRLHRRSAKQLTPRKRKVPQKTEATFSAPLLDFYAESLAKPAPPKRLLHTSRTARNDKTIGQITHYYDKIHVGVIKLSGNLTVGDCITYETDEGPYKQVVESMEIDREPVFKASRGKEIGLKLRKKPRLGCLVLK